MKASLLYFTCEPVYGQNGILHGHASGSYYAFHFFVGYYMGFALNLAQKAGRFTRAAGARALGAVTGTLSGARRVVGGAVRVGNTIQKAIKKADQVTGGALSLAADVIPGARQAANLASRGLSGAKSALKAIDRAQGTASRVGKRALGAVEAGTRAAEGAVQRAEEFVASKRPRT